MVRLASVALLGGLVTMALRVPQVRALEVKPEKRVQAVLQVRGNILPDGEGFLVTEVIPDGPATRLQIADGRARGSLEKGDIITAVEGQPFHDVRELLDLLNEAYRARALVRITVRDGGKGEPLDWIARPTVILGMAVPPGRARLPVLSDVPPETPQLVVPEALKK